MSSGQLNLSGDSSACTVQCCECGTLMSPNPTGFCIACLRSRIDITQDIQRQCVLACCPKCCRFLAPPSHWVAAEPESKELLALCLKRVKGLNKLRLVDAGFIWTEPHSRRIKLRVAVQAEVMNGAIAEQSAEIEFSLQSQQCEQCTRGAAKDFWRATVQLRQHTPHPKTLLYLEQLILKHQAHRDCTGVRKASYGLDFFFAQKQDAKKLVDFLCAHSPSRCQNSEQLVSHDTHSNTYNYKHTFCIEVAPVCKDDIVCLPPAVAKRLGTIGQLCVVLRVTDKLRLIDPITCRTAEVNAKQYWHAPFQSLNASLSGFTVTNCELVHEHSAGYSRHAPADAWLLTDSDLSAEEVHCRTHLGHVINCGDSVLGLDLRAANVNHAEVEKLDAAKMPDVVLVKKVYPQDRCKQRKWRLRHLDDSRREVEEDNPSYQNFLEDLEEDKELRRGVNIFKDSRRKGLASEASEANDAPQVSVEEMLEDLTLDDAPME